MRDEGNKKPKKNAYRPAPSSKQPAAEPPSLGGAVSIPDSKTGLPHGYGHDRIRAMVRDPHCIFTYWDLTGDRYASLIRTQGDTFVRACRWVLRVNDHTAGTCHWIDVDPKTGNWYIDVHSNTSYSVDIGLLSPEGRFLVVASSPVVTTPRDRVSERVDTAWVVSDEQFERLFDLAGGNQAMGASESISSAGIHRMRQRVIRELQPGRDAPSK